MLFARRDDLLLFMNNIGYIFIVQRLGKQSKLILSRLDSISNLKLNLRIHGQYGPDAHAGADLQAFLIFCFKPILISAHKLTLLIYGDNTYSPSWSRSTRESAEITQERQPWLAKPSDQASTGRRPWPTPRLSSDGAQGASFSPSSNTSRLRPCE